MTAAASRDGLVVVAKEERGRVGWCSWGIHVAASKQEESAEQRGGGGEEEKVSKERGGEERESNRVRDSESACG